ncbi:hypothetical protein DRN98_03570, partial [Methanosarcinales archaeon]
MEAESNEFQSSSGEFTEDMVGMFIKIEGVGIYKILEYVDEHTLRIDYRPAKEDVFTDKEFFIYEQIKTIQEFVDRVTSTVTINYDSTNTPNTLTLTLPLEFSGEINLSNLLIDLGLNFGDSPLADLSMEALENLNPTVNISGNIDLVLSFDNQSEASMELFVDDISLEGLLSLDVENPTFKARLGVLGITAGNGSKIELKVGVKIEKKEGQGQISLEELISGDIEEYLSAEFTEKTAKITLSNLGVEGNLSGVSFNDSDKIIIVIPITQPFDGGVLLPQLPSSFNLKDLKREDLLEALKLNIDFLRDALSLIANIPIINSPSNQLFPFIGPLYEMIGKLNQPDNNTPPPQTLQAIEERIEEILGLEKERFSFSLCNDHILKIKFTPSFSFSQNFPLNLELTKIKEGVLQGFNSLMEEGGNSLTISGLITPHIELGIDYSNPHQPTIFFYEYNESQKQGTYVEGNFKIIAQNLNSTLNLAPLLFKVENGNLTIDKDGNPSTDDTLNFFLYLDTDNEDGHYNWFTEEFSKVVKFKEVEGGFNISLPGEVDIYGNNYSAGSFEIEGEITQQDNKIKLNLTTFNYPDIDSLLGDTIDTSLSSPLTETIPQLIESIKEDILSAVDFSWQIPGTNLTLNDILGNQIIETLIDLANSTQDFAQAYNWEDGFRPYLLGAQIIDYLTQHWLENLPGYLPSDSPWRLTVEENALTISLEDWTGSYAKEVELNLNDILSKEGKEVQGEVKFDLNTNLVLNFALTLNWSRENSSPTGEITLNKLQFSASAIKEDINLEAKIGLISAEVKGGIFTLNLGGEFKSDNEGKIIFDTSSFSNQLDVSLPAYITLEETLSQIGTLTISDDNLFDSTLPVVNFKQEEALLSVLPLTGPLAEKIYNLGSYIETIQQKIKEDDALNQNIAGTDISLNRLLNLEHLFALGTYIKHYLQPYLYPQLPLPEEPSIPFGAYGKVGIPTLSGLIKFLKDNWMSKEMSSNIEGDVLSLEFNNTLSFSQTANLALEKWLESINLEILSEVGLEISGETNVDFILNIDLRNGLFDFQLNQLDFDLQTSANDIIVQALLGALKLTIGQPYREKGSFSLNLSGDITLTSQGITFTPGDNNSLDIALPLYASLGDTPLRGNTGEGIPHIYISNLRDNTEEGIPQISISGPLFNTITLYIDENFSSALDNFKNSTLQSIKDNLLSSLENITISPLFNQQLPFTKETLGDIFGYPAEIEEIIATLSSLPWSDITDLNTLIETINGILPEDKKITYDSQTKEILIPFSIPDTTRVKTLPLLLDINLGESGVSHLYTEAIAIATISSSSSEIELSIKIDNSSINIKDFSFQATIEFSVEEPYVTATLGFVGIRAGGKGSRIYLKAT